MGSGAQYPCSSDTTASMQLEAACHRLDVVELTIKGPFRIRGGRRLQEENKSQQAIQASSGLDLSGTCLKTYRIRR